MSNNAALKLVNDRKYNGIELEKELGLNVYDAQFRELDPQTGRWWQIDPKTDEMLMWSTYASNYDNPIRFEDNLGDTPNGCPPNCGGNAMGYLGTGLGQLTEGIARFADNVVSFFTKSETEVSKPSSVTGASLVITTTRTTDYGLNLLGWVQNSKRPNATVSNGPSIIKNVTTTEVKAELKQQVTIRKVGVSTKTALDGSSVEVKGEGVVNIKGVPVFLSATGSQNFNTGEDKVKVKVGLGTSSNQAFGQVEVSNTNNQTKTSISIGVEEKTGNVKKTFSIGKSF